MIDELLTDVYIFLDPEYKGLIGVGVSESIAFLTPDQARDVAAAILESINNFDSKNNTLH